MGLGQVFLNSVDLQFHLEQISSQLQRSECLLYGSSSNLTKIHIIPSLWSVRFSCITFFFFKPDKIQNTVLHA